MVPNRKGAVTSAVLVDLGVEPARCEWRWRERPALALLAWEALARDPLARLRRIQVESIGTTINFRPAAITNRDIAASALLIASRLALTAALDALERRRGATQDSAVPVVNQIRTYWWCSPPRTGRQRMLPARSTARETGASFSKDRCVRTSLS